MSKSMDAVYSIGPSIHIFGKAGEPGHSDAFPTAMRALFRFLVCTMIMWLLGFQPVHAGALDWLKGRKSPSRPAAREQTVQVGQTVQLARPAQGEGVLPDFFSAENGPDMTGKGMNLVKFTETHWTNLRKKIEEVTLAITGKIQDKKTADITGKLSIIVVQVSREMLKSSASGIYGLQELNRNVERLVEDLGRIVTAPNQETMDNLDRAIAKVAEANRAMGQSTRSYLSAAESLIGIGAESYQTLELIPSLSIPALDVYLQGSKQLMRQVQSNGEALKGLLLNVINSAEQVSAGLELMSSTVKSTLRFSDHFAFKQYPLINLPVPSREKLFAQIGGIKNTVKGVDNTLSIGDSQVKNSAQQLTHLFQGAISKMKDALKFQDPVDPNSGSFAQISNYALNQVNGLFQRLKENVAEMKMQMAKQFRADPAGNSPRISMETREESQIRRSAAASTDKLPLYLLGEGVGNRNAPSDPMVLPEKSQGETMVLFSEGKSRNVLGDRPGRTSPSLGDTSGTRLPDSFIPDEMRILQRELGGKVSVSGLSPKQSQSLEEPGIDGDQFSQGLPDDPRNPEGMARFQSDSSLEKAVIDESGDGSSREFELLRMDTPPSTTSEGADLIPLLRLDEPDSEKE